MSSSMLFDAAFSRSIVRTIFIISFIVLQLLQSCSCQQSPLPGISIFDDTVRYRTDVCDRARAYFNDEIELELRDALTGLDLSVYITDYSDTNGTGKAMFRLTDQGTIPEWNPGAIADILDELGRRAGFTWRNKLATSKGIDMDRDDNKTWTDLLYWSMESFDISADYWHESNERKAKGATYSFPWYDDSLVLITKSKKKWVFMSFMEPFDTKVWGMIVAFIFGTGILYNFLNKLSDNTDSRQVNCLSAIFLSAITFTGHFEFRPNSHAARLLSFSWSFWALIIVAAYTANMASFLLTRNVPSLGVDSLDPVVNRKMSICLWGKTSLDDYMNENYAEYAANTTGSSLFRDYFSENEVIQGLINDDCDVALVGKQAFEIFQRDTDTGDTCGLVKSGRIVEQILSGFVTKLDTGKLCTSLIQYVIDLHLHEMSEDGFLDSVWVDVLDKLGPNECGEDNVVTSEEVSVPLTMRDMYGIFALHGFCLIFSVLLAFIHGWTNRRDTIAKSICENVFSFRFNCKEVERKDDSSRSFQSRDGGRRGSMWSGKSHSEKSNGSMWSEKSRDGGRRGSMRSESSAFLYDSIVSADVPSTLRRRKSHRSSMTSNDCKRSSLKRGMVLDKEGAPFEDMKRSSLAYHRKKMTSAKKDPFTRSINKEHSGSRVRFGTTTICGKVLSPTKIDDI